MPQASPVAQGDCSGLTTSPAVPVSHKRSKQSAPAGGAGLPAQASQQVKGSMKATSDNSKKRTPTVSYQSLAHMHLLTCILEQASIVAIVFMHSSGQHHRVIQPVSTLHLVCLQYAGQYKQQCMPYMPAGHAIDKQC